MLKQLKVITDRRSRLTDEAVQKVVQEVGNGSLKRMFKNLQKPREISDDNKGMVYFSRYNADLNAKFENLLEIENHEGHHETHDYTQADSITNDNSSHSAIGDGTLAYMNPILHKEKKMQYAISLATIASRPERRLKMAKDGAIAALIELTNIEDISIRRSCAAAFSFLADEPLIRKKMVEDGCILAISILSNCNSNDIKSDCAKIICNLSSSSGFEQRMVRDGASFILINIGMNYHTVLEICLKSLLNLACVPEKYSKIEEVNDAILHFAAMPLHSVQEITLLSALCNLSALRSNQLRLIEDGCVKVIDKMLKSHNGTLRYNSFLVQFTSFL